MNTISDTPPLDFDRITRAVAMVLKPRMRAHVLRTSEEFRDTPLGPYMDVLESFKAENEGAWKELEPTVRLMPRDVLESCVEQGTLDAVREVSEALGDKIAEEHLGQSISDFITDFPLRVFLGEGDFPQDAHDATAG